MHGNAKGWEVEEFIDGMRRKVEPLTDVGGRCKNLKRGMEVHGHMIEKEIWGRKMKGRDV